MKLLSAKYLSLGLLAAGVCGVQVAHAASFSSRSSMSSRSYNTGIVGVRGSIYDTDNDMPRYSIVMHSDGEEESGIDENTHRYKTIQIQTQNNPTILDNRKYVYNQAGEERPNFYKAELEQGNELENHTFSLTHLYKIKFDESVTNNEVFKKLYRGFAPYDMNDSVYLIDYKDSANKYYELEDDYKNMIGNIEALHDSHLIATKGTVNDQFIKPSIVTDTCNGEGDYSLSMKTEFGKLIPKLRNCNILSSISIMGMGVDGNDSFYGVQKTYIKAPDNNSQGHIYNTILKNHTIAVQMAPDMSDSTHETYYLLVSKFNY